ncbi:acyl-CoA thioester hydrolase, YbgC/YbaW family [alpha proteobacterium HIMB59]|nr:acyl-CoA thioester hydrolase, YbgC/YbaW family [alpha proteobacterium HIMB59]
MYQFNTKVYYEDTDSGGVVYYANYLKFIERARTNLIQELGFSLRSLSENYDCHFVVKNIHCNYIQSAKLEDELSIKTKFLEIKKASFKLEQIIYREDKAIFESEVLMVNINSKGKPLKIPEPLITAINV